MAHTIDLNPTNHTLPEDPSEPVAIMDAGSTFGTTAGQLRATIKVLQLTNGSRAAACQIIKPFVDGSLRLAMVIVKAAEQVAGKATLVNADERNETPDPSASQARPTSLGELLHSILQADAETTRECDCPVCRAQS